MEDHRTQYRVVIHIAHVEAQCLVGRASSAIGGLHRDPEFTDLCITGTTCYGAADGIQLQPFRCIKQRIGEISVVLIGKQSADVLVQDSVLHQAHFKICGGCLYCFGGVIDLANGDRYMFEFGLLLSSAGQSEGVAADLLLIGKGTHHPDRWAAIVQHQQII